MPSPELQRSKLRVAVTYREADTVLALALGDAAAAIKQIDRPSGTRPGFLTSVAEIIRTTVARASRGQPSGPETLRYVYGDRVYDLRLLEAVPIARFSSGERSYEHVVRARFETALAGARDGSRFELVYGTAGHACGNPHRHFLSAEMVASSGVDASNHENPPRQSKRRFIRNGGHYAAMALRAGRGHTVASTAIRSSPTRRWMRSISTASRPAMSSVSAFTQATRCEDTRSGARRGRAGRVRGLWRHSSHALSGGIARAGCGARRCERATAIWCGRRCLRTAEAAKPLATYEGGRVSGDRFTSARWDLLPADRYMWGSVQTLRGCPKHCSFCSVWRTDGQQPRQRAADAVVHEVVELRRRGFRFILLSDDNFYPVTLGDLRLAERQGNAGRLAELKAIRAERFELMEMLAKLPSDLVFYTQITMEAAEDPEFLKAMNRARIRGALVGVESVTPEGLKAVFKDFNCAGESLVTRLKEFRKHGVHILGSFIFGLPTDKPETFKATAELAQKSDIAFAQFVMLTPFPGTVDFAKWEERMADDPTRIGGVPLTRYWLIPSHQRPKVYSPHPLLSADDIRVGTQSTWDRFYSVPAIWERARIVKSLKGRLLFLLISKLYRQMYANTGIATDSARVTRSRNWARLLLRPCRKLFVTTPMPELEIPT